MKASGALRSVVIHDAMLGGEAGGGRQAGRARAAHKEEGRSYGCQVAPAYDG